MAGGGRLRARAPSPQLRPCGLADAESKLALKSAVGEAPCSWARDKHFKLGKIFYNILCLFDRFLAFAWPSTPSTAGEARWPAKNAYRVQYFLFVKPFYKSFYLYKNFTLYLFFFFFFRREKMGAHTMTQQA